MASSTIYVDVRGVPWTITTYDTVQPLTGTQIVAYGPGYSGGVLGAVTYGDAIAQIVTFAALHNRAPATLDDAHRHIERYSTGPVKFEFIDKSGVPWAVYEITSAADGPLGFYALNNSPYALQIVGPSSSISALSSALNDFQAAQASSTTYGLTDSSTTAGSATLQAVAADPSVDGTALVGSASSVAADQTSAGVLSSPLAVGMGALVAAAAGWWWSKLRN